MSYEAQRIRSTTILSIRHKGHVVMGGDGQVSLGPTIIKGNAKKVRYLYQNRVLSGFAGSTADALTLFDLFEKKLEKNKGIYPVQRWSLPKIGVRIKFYDVWKPCCWWRIKPRH